MKGRLLFLIILILFCATLTSCTKKADDVHLHDYTVTTIEATCTTNGYVLYKCSCGDSYREETSALGHNYIEQDQNYQCSRCNRCEDEGFTFELIKYNLYNDTLDELVDTYFVKNVYSEASENGIISIPKKHLGCAVTGIYKGALYYVRNTTVELLIPSTIKYIGSNLFTYEGQGTPLYETIALESVIFENSCSNLNISHSAFQYCKKISNISMPSSCVSMFNYDDGVSNHFLFEDTPYYKTHRIEDNGLYYLFGMLLETDKEKIGSKVSIKLGTTAIANCSFSRNTNIKVVEIPPSVRYIGQLAFRDCYSLSTVTFKGTEDCFDLVYEENTFLNCDNLSFQFNE